jgi:fibronectin-binding autotransporter adhesin
MNRLHGFGSFRLLVRLPWLVGAMFAIALALDSSTHAANGTWNVDAAGNWTTAGNWLNGTVPGVSGTTFTSTDVATFSTTLTAGRTITVDANRNVKDILFSNSSGFGYTLSSGTLRLTNGGSIESTAGNGDHIDTISSAVVLASGGTASFLSNGTSTSSLLSITGAMSGGNVIRLAGSNTGSNSVTGTISGAMRIQKDDVGYWAVSNATSSGGITVNSGTLDFKASLNGRGNVSVTGGTLFASTGTISTANQSISVNGGRVEINGAFGLNVATSAFTLTSGTFKTTGDFTATAASSVNLNGGSLDVGGNFRIDNANTTIGGNVIVRGGTTTFITPDYNSKSFTISSGSNVLLGAVVLGSSASRYPGIAFNIGNGGVLADAMFASSIFGWDLSNGEPTIGVTFNHSNANYAFSTLLTGTFFSNSQPLLLSGSGGIRQNGPGKTTLTGSNSFVGNVTVSTGTLAMGHSTALGSTSNRLFVNGGTFDLQGYGLSIGGLTGSSSGVITSSTAGAVTLNVNEASAATYSGRIEDGGGTVAVTKSGAGVLALGGTNTFSGGATVGAGGLTFLTLNAKPSTGTAAFAAGTTLGLGVSSSPGYFTGADVDNALAGVLTGNLANVSLSATSAVGVDTSAGDYSYAVSLGGSRGLVKLGANTFTLSTSGSYANPLSVTAGTLAVSGSLQTSGSITVESGGAFSVTGTMTASARPTLKAGGSITVGTGGSLTSPAFANVATGTLAVSGGLFTKASGADFGTAVNPVAVNLSSGTLQVNGNNTSTAFTMTGGFYNSTAASEQFQPGTITGGAYSSTGGADLRGSLTVGGTASVSFGGNVGVQGTNGQTLTLSGGALAVTGNINVGAGMNAANASYFNQSGGSATAASVVIGASSANGANTVRYTLSSGTMNVGRIVLSATNFATTGSNTLRITGGVLNTGTGGIVHGGGGGTQVIELVGGVIGASGNWSSSLPMALQGAGPIFRADDGAVTPTPRTITLSGVLSGTGGFTQSGLGVVSLSAINTYSGTTQILGGRLQVDPAGGLSNTARVVINGGAAEFKWNSSSSLAAPITLTQGTLSGTGAIGSTVTADSLAATFSPGNSPGIMSFGASQTWNSFTYLWENNNFLGTTAGTDFDQITIAGSLALTGSTGSYLLDITSLTSGNIAGDVGNFSDTNRSWTILTTTGGISGFNAAHWTLSTTDFTSSPAATGSWSISNVGNDLVLNYVIVVPEPATLTLAGLGVIVAGWAARRRRLTAGRR